MTLDVDVSDAALLDGRTPKRIGLVINAASGGLIAGHDSDGLRARLVRAGLEPSNADEPESPLDQRIRSAAATPGIEALVVAGGDGTLSCAAAELAGKDLPLGVLPLGTMNLFAKDLGLPTDLDTAIEAIAAGCHRRIDVGEVNGHVFLINSVLGMPARMQRHRETSRGAFDLHGARRWSFGLLRHLRRYPRLSIGTRCEGVERHLRVRMLAVVNNDYAEAPGRILARTRLDSGLLTLYAFAQLSPWLVLRLALGFALGDWRHLPGLERVSATDLTITARRRALRVMNDGEVLMIPPPLNYRIRPKALSVIVRAEDEASPSMGSPGPAAAA